VREEVDTNFKPETWMKVTTQEMGKHVRIILKWMLS